MKIHELSIFTDFKLPNIQFNDAIYLKGFERLTIFQIIL